MIPQNELRAEAIRETVQEVAQAHLPLHAEGYVVTDAMIYDVLMKAALEGISLDAVCRDMEHSASGNAIREVINQRLEATQVRQYEADVNDALSARLPRALHKRTVEVAFDEHDEPCYGKSAALLAFARRSRAVQGTTRFFRIASAYIIYRQLRLTLAVTFVLPGDTPAEVVRRLHQRLVALTLRVRVLYLDRGFCGCAVIGYLQQQQQPAVVACTVRGKQGGTRQVCQGRRSYRTRYTFTDGTQVEMAVVATLVPDQNQKRRRKWLLFVVIGLDWSPQVVYQRYRNRFGIESTYRLLRRVRIKTTSRNPAFRFFVLAFALLLVNLWAILRWVVARLPGPGPQRLDPLHFQFHRFVTLLRRAIEQRYGVSMTVPFLTPAPNS
jgi:hypothetical protein